MSDFPATIIKGSFWANKEKETEKQPNINGVLNALEDIPAGTKIYFAAWGPNKGDSGENYYSLRGNAAAKKAGEKRVPRPALDDEIPF